MAANPDSPGRSVPRPILDRGGLARAITETLPGEDLGELRNLERQAMEELRRGKLADARNLIQTAINRAAAPDRRELRKVSDRLTWLITWMGRAELEAKRAELEKERARIDAAIAVLEVEP